MNMKPNGKSRLKRLFAKRAEANTKNSGPDATAQKRPGICFYIAVILMLGTLTSFNSPFDQPPHDDGLLGRMIIFLIILCFITVYAFKKEAEGKKNSESKRQHDGSPQVRVTNPE